MTITDLCLRTIKLTMYNIADLKRATGYTINQLRTRLDLLSPILSDGFHRGPRDKILVQDKVLATLQRMYELEREGLSAKEAWKRIVQELGNRDEKGTVSVSEGDGRLIEALEREIHRLEGEVAFLRGQVSQLTLLALPRPRRWLAWLWRSFERGN